ncbi:MAG: diacylglycerol kinase family lipid kinase [Acidimicrobiia bacterium]|nr:diacylglycerol kinase family lipid kinase [Acidimicrobiia bacterium]MDH3396801.1 diacylglycerol kinase family lipid kinase [Acidimicrobiia bacterium]MDH5615575.1 diacylglycerol kinase family lipid kinase [Acidimicrobiia bacterium]
MNGWLVVANPYAGRRKEIEQRLRRALDAQRIEAEIVAPHGEAEVRASIDQAVAGGCDRVVAVGGDGTINLVVGALMQHQWEQPPILGVLPTGSGSDFVRTFGIPQRLEDAARHLSGDQVYASDVGLLRGSWGERHFINVADVGVLAALVQRAERLPRWLGLARYHVALPLVYPRFPEAEISLVAGRRTYEGPAMLVVFANAQFFGGGWNIAPRATVTDGRFDVQVFNASKRDVPRLWLRAKNGDHLRDKKVHRFTADRFTLETDPAWPVEADGEFFGTGRVEGEILTGAINIKI